LIAEQYNNYLVLEGIVYDDKIPDWRTLISYDPSCLEIIPESENPWTCKNRQQSYANSESFRYWLRIKIIGKDCNTCITIVNYPEFGQICFKDNYYIKAGIVNACNALLNNYTCNNIDEIIYFAAEVQCINPDPEMGCWFLPAGIIGEVRTRSVIQEIPLEKAIEYSPYHIIYKSRYMYSARDFLPQENAHYGELTFIASYMWVSAASNWFAEFPAFFNVDSLLFQNEIKINNDNTRGYQIFCLPNGSPLYFGNKVIFDASGWPHNCPVASWLLTYIGGSENPISSQNFNILGSPSYTPQSASGFILPQGDDGQELIYDFTWKMAIENGPALDLDYPKRVGIFNGFRAGPITVLNMPERGIIIRGDHLNLKANPVPDLAQATYTWHYTYQPDNGVIPAIADGDISPSVSSDNTTTLTPSGPGTYIINYNVADDATHFSADSPTLILKVEPKLVIDSPIGLSVFWITPEPRMPEIICRAHIDGVSLDDQSTLKFNWKIKLAYENKELIKKSPENTLGLMQWTPIWEDDEFGGGNVIIDVGVKYGDDSLTAHLIEQDAIWILGQNANSAAVLAHIASVSTDGDVIQCTRGCARTETDGFYQFGTDGLPFRESGNGPGRGIMQLTYPDFINTNTLWDWQTNITMGAQNVAVVKRISRAWFQSKCSGYDPSEEELHKDIYRLYNRGTGEDDHYFTFVDDEEPWFFRNRAYANDCGQNTCTPRYEHKAHGPNEPAGRCINSGCCYADIAYGRED
jgi:hypothetical protein